MTALKSPKRSVYLRLELKITSASTDDLLARWRFGRELLKAKAGKRKLPDGLIDDVIKTLGREGVTVSRREIQYRVRLAEVYTTEALLRKIICTIGSWSEIIAAGFPAVDADDQDLDEVEDEPADGWEQLSLLPGFKKIVKIRGRETPVADMTVPESIAYREKYRGMHEGFGKTLDLIEATVDLIIAGWDGNADTKAIDAYNLAISDSP